MAATVPISKAERDFIRTALIGNPPHRGDGRELNQYRGISLELGVAPLANGSAKVAIGRHLGVEEYGGGTEVLAAVKCEVENVGDGEEDGVDGGRVSCTVTCSPTAYPQLGSAALDDLSADLTTVIRTTLSHHSLRPKNLTIIPEKTSWCVYLDMTVISDEGNVYDALFIAARAALWDTKVPRTKSIAYRAPEAEPTPKASSSSSMLKVKKKASGKDRVDEMDVDEPVSSFDTRQLNARATGFELSDYWDEGEILDGRASWPVCVTLNVMPPNPVHFLDASPHEETAVPLKLLVIYSFASHEEPQLQGFRIFGPTGDLDLRQVGNLTQASQKYALSLHLALNKKLKEEDERRRKLAKDLKSRKRK